MEKDPERQHPTAADLAIGETLPENSGQRKDVDVAATFLANLDPSILEEPISAKEFTRLRWKIDLIILPIISGTIILGAVDKVVISNAKIYGMMTDAHLTSAEYSWVGSILYFGYLLFEYPAAILIQRYPVAKFFSITVFIWAVMMLCTAATSNFGGLATVRFLMGMAESVIFPVASILTVMWWTNAEQVVRLACWNNQFSSIFSGIISYGIGHTSTSISPWRLIFLVLGGFSVLWSIFLYVFLPDSPTKCWYMSDREKFVALERVKGNNTGVEDKTIKWYQVRECLTDPRTYLLAIFAIAQNVPNGGLITFASTIVSGLGYNKLITTLLGIPTGVIATAWQLGLSIPASRLKNKRCVIIASANLVTLTCAILMMKLPSSNKNGLLAAYYCFYTYWAPYVLSTSLPLANTSGHTKKVTMNAVYFLSYCIGNIIGPQVFRASDAPGYAHGYAGLMACIVVAMASISAYGFLCHLENKRRDRKLAECSDDDNEPVAAAFSDLTDKEKWKTFRYTF